MLKPIEINFKLDKTIKRALTTELMIKSHDINVIEFHISFDGLELTADHTVKVLSVFNDTKSQTNVNCDIVDGKAIYRPDTSIISQYEHVLNYVYVYHGDQSLDVRSFIYKVGLSEIDKTALETKSVYDQSYADLLADFEQALSDYKDSLPQADSVRADIDEILNQFSEDSQKAIGDLGEVSATVEIAEASRVEKESERVQAETERIQAEQARKEAETLREESYEQKVDTALVEADIVEKVDNKVTELTPRMNELTAQLAHIDRKKLDKNLGAVTSSDLSQEVKEIIHGDRPLPIAEIDSILEDNIVDGQISRRKLSNDLGKKNRRYRGHKRLCFRDRR